MERLHKNVIKRIGWYKRWHNNPKSNLLHNLILAGVVPLFGLLILPFALTFAQTSKQLEAPFPSFYIPPTPTPTVVPTPSVKIETYRVQLGDNLWSIAQKYLGNGNRYPEIIDWNKDKYPELVSNPNLIEAGMVLIVSKTIIPPAGGLYGIRPEKFESGGSMSPEVLDFLDLFNIVSLIFLGLLVVAGAARWLIIRI
jgi:hypothetical protein